MAKLLQLSALLALLNYASATPIPTEQKFEPCVFNLPKTYAALGDSFAAGLGSGFPLDNDVQCQRQNGSYPSQLLKLNPFSGEPSDFQFTACSGDELNDIDGQVTELAHKKFDLVTLTIGGNDFGFSDIAKACVYQTLSPNITDPQKVCDLAFNAGFAQIANQSSWEKFTQKVSLVNSEVVDKGGRLFITNYPKFFAEPKDGDACDHISFFPIPQLAALNMTATNRRRANELTDLINDEIKKITSHAGSNVLFVDFDKLYEGKRFCEPGNEKDPIGANNPNVFFNDLTTILPVPGVVAVVKQTPGLKVDITNVLQQSSVFHPKVGAHRVLAAELYFRILKDSFIQV